MRSKVSGIVNLHFVCGKNSWVRSRVGIAQSLRTSDFWEVNTIAFLQCMNGNTLHYIARTKWEWHSRELSQRAVQRGSEARTMFYARM